jgi:hypothetical protein
MYAHPSPFLYGLLSLPPPSPKPPAHVSTPTILDAGTKSKIWPTAKPAGDTHPTYETDSTTDEQDSDGNTISRRVGIKQDKGEIRHHRRLQHPLP